MYRCRTCGRVFKSKKAYLMHIILGLEGGYIRKGRKR